MTQRREHLVVDTGAFIRLKQLDKFGYENVHVVEGVALEIRDEAARQQLQFSLAIPKISMPTEKDVRFVRSFAKMTGDLGFLSDTDIHVIALTYMLQRMTGDVSRLKSRPEWMCEKVNFEKSILNKKAWGILCTQPEKLKAQGVGDTVAESRLQHQETPSVSQCPNSSGNLSEPEPLRVVQDASIDGGKEAIESYFPLEPAQDLCDNTSASVTQIQTLNAAGTASQNPVGETLEKSNDQLTLHDDQFGISDEDGSEAGDWLGEENLEQFITSKREICVEGPENESLRVACLTTDYSVQNVLLQMGLSILSVDGYRICQTKNWVLLCRGCKAVTVDTTRRFCSQCGNMTVFRAPAVVNENGKVVVEDCRRAFNPRGKIYSIPKPKGGRQGDLILCEDQLFIGGRDRLVRHQQKLQEKERVARNPFNPDSAYEQKGWWARNAAWRPAKTIQIGMGPGNPNSNRWQKRRTHKR